MLIGNKKSYKKRMSKNEGNEIWYNWEIKIDFQVQLQTWQELFDKLKDNIVWKIILNLEINRLHESWRRFHFVVEWIIKVLVTSGL